MTIWMNARACLIFAVLLAAGLRLQAQTPAHPGGDRERLIGAWHLVHIESPGPDGKLAPGPPPKGMLVYTRDGHVAVQLMYPPSAAPISNVYVHEGYEASFGTFTLDEQRHIVTHHIEASNTRDLLVGKDLPRAYTLNKEGQLVIRSADPSEHWFVVWQHD